MSNPGVPRPSGASAPEPEQREDGQNYKTGYDKGYKEGKDAGYKEGMKAGEEASARKVPNQQDELPEDVTSGEISAHNTHIADWNLPDDHIVPMPRENAYRVEFQQLYKYNPRVLVGLSVFRDNDKSPAIGHAVEAAKVDRQGCDLRLYNHLHALSNTLGASWMAIPYGPNLPVHFESGVTDIHGGNPNKLSQEAGEMMTYTKQARFSRPFSSNPKFACWFTDLAQVSQDKEKHHVHELSVEAANDTSLSSQGIVFKSADARWNYSRIGWLAWDAEADDAHVKTGEMTIGVDLWAPNKTITFPGKPFAKAPAVFAAISHIACGHGERPYVGCWLSGINKDGFKATYGGPLTSYVAGATFRWIAISV